MVYLMALLLNCGAKWDLYLQCNGQLFPVEGAIDQFLKDASVPGYGQLKANEIK